MTISKRAKTVIGAAALTGAVLMTGGAFTATGLDSTATASQAVGGTVSQSVTGVGTLTGITYGYTDNTNTAVNLVDLAFTGSDGHDVSVTLSGGADPVTVACSTIASNASTCTIADYVGLTSIDVVVTPGA